MDWSKANNNLVRDTVTCENVSKKSLIIFFKPLATNLASNLFIVLSDFIAFLKTHLQHMVLEPLDKSIEFQVSLVSIDSNPL